MFETWPIHRSCRPLTFGLWTLDPAATAQPPLNEPQPILPMPTLENEQHETFAQARFAGKTLVEAHYAAGYAGDKASASRLNQVHEVRERIAELFREAAA